MNAEEITKYVKAAAILAGALGVNVEPQDFITIGSAAGIIYGFITAIEGYFFKKDKGATVKK